MSRPDSSTKKPAKRRRLSRGKRIAFGLAAIAMSLIFLLAVEGVVRLSGYGGYPPLMKSIGPIEGGTLVVTDPAGAASYFFANKSRAGSMYENALLVPKPANTVRIFLCGESAMKGFPQPLALSAGAYLQAMLGDCLPDRKIEIINFATTAVASFPVLGMLEDAIDYDPDLVIVYCGNNEFYGAYGVASLHSAGRSTSMMRVQRSLRSTGVAQLIEKITAPSQTEGQTLMEHVMARSVIPPGDGVREAAAKNLKAHIGGMVRLCKSRGVPILVCTVAGNERDLAPLGAEDFSGLPTEQAHRLEAPLAAARSAGASFEIVAESMRTVLKSAPDSAMAHYLLGRALHAMNQHSEARTAFAWAVDLDTMPWRPTSAMRSAITDATLAEGGVLCDVYGAFSAASPGGSIGDELMDDHVHPSLEGQALMARTWLASMCDLSGPIAPDRARVAVLPDNRTYARRMGENRFDRYGAAHTVRVLCDIPFYRASNPRAYERFDSVCRELEKSMTPDVLEVVRQWQTPAPHRGGIQRPIGGMVGRVLLRNRNFEEAEKLFDMAARCVPAYSSLSIEYTYFTLAARQRLIARLDAREREMALGAIQRGRTLMKYEPEADVQLQRWVGRLYQLRDEYLESIPFLAAASESLTGTDQLATDQALVFAYLKSGQSQQAQTLVERRLAAGGPHAEVYRRLLQQREGSGE